jgi:hypothetical protein
MILPLKERTAYIVRLRALRSLPNAFDQGFQIRNLNSAAKDFELRIPRILRIQPFTPLKVAGGIAVKFHQDSGIPAALMAHVKKVCCAQAGLKSSQKYCAEPGNNSPHALRFIATDYQDSTGGNGSTSRS